MKSVKYDPIALLSILKPSKFEAECEKMVLSLLNANAETLKGLSEYEIQAFYKNVSKQPSMENLSASNILLARLQCQNESSQTKKNEMIQTIIPDVHILCQAIQSCLDSNAEKESTANTFCCNQLFKFAQLMDLQEEGSRRHFLASCSSILNSTETPDEILEDVVKALSKAHDHEEEYLNCIGDIVDKLHDQLRILSILTLVLEFTSPRMVSHASMERFIDHIVPVLSTNDVLVREASVSCLGRLALLSGENIVMEKYKPLLLSIVSKASEKVEIRAQAMLALSDLTLLYEGTLRPIEVEGRRLDLIEFVNQMLEHENPSVIAVATEVAIKLLFSGKVQDHELAASLVVIFFNKIYEDYDEDEDVHEVGSIYRMQQLLSLFFPSYVIKGHDVTHIIIPMLNKIAIKKRGRKSFPIARMIEYVYSTSELGLEERGKVEGKVDDDKKDNALLVCLEISKFLVCNCDNLSNTTLRTLCKILGGADVDLGQSPLEKLIELKWIVHDLTTLITDVTSLESLETMVELLEDIPENTTLNNHNQENEIIDAKVFPSLENEVKTSESSLNTKNGRNSSRRRQALEEVN
jgi:condensin complex subunit 3